MPRRRQGVVAMTLAGTAFASAIVALAPGAPAAAVHNLPARRGRSRVRESSTA